MTRAITKIALGLVAAAYVAVVLFGPPDFLSAQGYYCCSLDNCVSFTCDEGASACHVWEEGFSTGGQCYTCLKGPSKPCGGTTVKLPTPRVTLLRGCNGLRFTDESAGGHKSDSVWRRTTNFAGGSMGTSFGVRLGVKIDPDFQLANWGSVCDCSVPDGAYIQAAAWAYIRRQGCGEDRFDPPGVIWSPTPDYSTWNTLGLVSMMASGTGENCEDAASGNFDPAAVSFRGGLACPPPHGRGGGAWEDDEVSGGERARWGARDAPCEPHGRERRRERCAARARMAERRGRPLPAMRLARRAQACGSPRRWIGGREPAAARREPRPRGVRGWRTREEKRREEKRREERPPGTCPGAPSAAAPRERPRPPEAPPSDARGRESDPPARPFRRRPPSALPLGLPRALSKGHRAPGPLYHLQAWAAPLASTPTFGVPHSEDLLEHRDARRQEIF